MKLLLFVLAIAFCTYSIDNATVPNTFSGGTRAVASQVNANFDSLETAINRTNDTLEQKFVRWLDFPDSTVSKFNTDSLFVTDTFSTNKGSITTLNSDSAKITKADLDTLLGVDYTTISTADIDTINSDSMKVTKVDIDTAGAIKFTGDINGSTINANISSIDADTVRADGASGLALFDDGDNGLFVEDGGQVGLGTLTPLASIHIEDSVAAAVRVNNTKDPDGSTIGGSVDLSFRDGNANHAGDKIGQINFVGQGTDNAFSGAVIESEVIVGEDTRSNMATNLAFYTMGVGEINAQKRLSISPSGFVGIDTTTPGSKFHVAGSGRFRDSVIVDVVVADTLNAINLRYVGQTPTLSSNSFAYSGNFCSLDTEGAVALDTLTSITSNISNEGQILIIHIVNSERDILIVDGGDLLLAGDFLLDHTNDMITLVGIGSSNWCEISRSDNL